MFVSVSVTGSSRTVASALTSSGRAVVQARGHLTACVQRPPAVRGYLQVTDADEVFGTHNDLNAEITDLDTQLAALVKQARPDLVAIKGVGVETAA